MKFFDLLLKKNRPFSDFTFEGKVLLIFSKMAYIFGFLWHWIIKVRTISNPNLLSAIPESNITLLNSITMKKNSQSYNGELISSRSNIEKVLKTDSLSVPGNAWMLEPRPIETTDLWIFDAHVWGLQYHHAKPVYGIIFLPLPKSLKENINNVFTSKWHFTP